MVVVIGLLVGVSVGLASLLPQNPTTVPSGAQPVDTDLPFSDTTTFASHRFSMDEGFHFNLVDGWELIGHTPDRSVDRYRFERKADAGATIFTLSVYTTSQTASFDALVQARYGAAYLREQEDVTVNGLAAKRVTADFLDMGATADVLVKADNNTFVSLYGIRQPSLSGDLTVAKEINFMQKSFQAN